MTVARPTFARFVALCLSCFYLAFGSAAHAAPQSGWWWNANEGGRGFFIEIVGNWMFLSAYFYDTDGRATWLVSNDPMPNPNVYEGRLLALQGGQSLTGDYRAPNAPTVPGNIRVDFSDDTHATMTWPGGAVAIERYAFNGPTTATFRPQTGWWWNPDESGRGFSVELQGSHMFIGAYMYDESGNPIWYVADAHMTTATRFEAPLLRFSGGQTLTGSYRPAQGPALAGSIIVDFSAPDRAVVTVSDDAIPGLAGKRGPKMFTVEPQKKKPVPAEVDRPTAFSGTFSQTTTVNADLAHSLVEISGSGIVWSRSDDLGSLEYPNATVYFPQGGQVTGTNTGQVRPGDDCNGVITGSGSHGFRVADGMINVLPNGQYVGHIRFDIDITSSMCGITLSHTYPISIPLSGAIRAGNTLAENPPAIDIPNGVTVNRWSFAGR